MKNKIIAAPAFMYLLSLRFSMLGQNIAVNIKKAIEAIKKE